MKEVNIKIYKVINTMYVHMLIKQSQVLQQVANKISQRELKITAQLHIINNIRPPAKEKTRQIHINTRLIA